eukprot:scaffold634_cov401-Prasinococcus_capsulatus_cf.AAC.6
MARSPSTPGAATCDRPRSRDARSCTCATRPRVRGRGDRARALPPRAHGGEPPCSPALLGAIELDAELTAPGLSQWLAAAAAAAAAA